MARPVIISLLWQPFARVGVELAARHGFDIACEYTLSESLRSEFERLGRRWLVLGQGELASDSESARLDGAVRVEEAAHVLRDHFTGAIDGKPQGARAVEAILDTANRRLPLALHLVNVLERVREKERVAAVVLNESEALTGKTAALWAKRHGIPVFLVSHAVGLGTPYTVTADFHADFMTFAGERGMEPYLDVGFPRERMIVTGSPAWDGFPALLTRRNDLRARLRAEVNAQANAPIVVFATTWNAKLTALRDADVYEASLRAFLSACAVLQRRGVSVHPLIKDRPPNADFAREAVERIAAEVGCTMTISFGFGDLASVVIGADVLVAHDSGAIVEAMMAGVPAVNLWMPASWFSGPAFGAEDAIPCVQHGNAEGLADVLQQLLTNAQIRQDVLRNQAARLPYFQIANDGNSAVRCAQAIAQRLMPPVDTAPANGSTRHVWDDVTRPAERLTPASLDLVAIIAKPPQRVLTIGAASTGAAVQERYSGATVITLTLSEALDLSTCGIERGSVDLVMLADVLQKMYDPWSFLERLKPFLCDEAVLLASVPNLRTIDTITNVLAGRWEYALDGLLDITNLRFFTRKSIGELFEQTGYRITRLQRALDERLPAQALAEGATCNIDTAKFSLKNVTAGNYEEIRTLCYYVEAVVEDVTASTD